MAERKRLPLTITWPEEMINFIKGPLFDRTRIKPAQLSELAMEDYLKANGYWEEYEKSLTEDIL